MVKNYNFENSSGETMAKNISWKMGAYSIQNILNALHPFVKNKKEVRYQEEQ